MQKKYLISKFLIIIFSFIFFFRNNFILLDINSDFLFELSIPKIKLSRIIYKYDSIHNDLSTNIKLLTDVKKINEETIVIAGHSGSGNNAFFNNLYLLELGDVIDINYNNIRYTYEINDIYEIEKTGYMNINTEITGLLYLITCKNHVNNKQIVYKAFIKN